MENPTNYKQDKMPEPINSWKQWLPLIILVVAAAIVGWQLGKPDSGKVEEKTSQTQSESTAGQTGDQAKKENEQTISSGSTLRFTGTLRPSKDPKRGNLMLETPTSIFYIFTSRDFMPMLDKEVVVTASGTAEKFVVTNIELKNERAKRTPHLEPLKENIMIC